MEPMDTGNNFKEEPEEDEEEMPLVRYTDSYCVWKFSHRISRD